MPRPTSILTFADHARARAHARFRENVRQAALNATPAEDEILEQLVDQVATGSLDLDEANATALAIFNGQRDEMRCAA